MLGRKTGFGCENGFAAEDFTKEKQESGLPFCAGSAEYLAEGAGAVLGILPVRPCRPVCSILFSGTVVLEPSSDFWECGGYGSYGR